MFQRLHQSVVIRQLVSCLGMFKLMLDYEPERDRNILKEGLLHPFPNQQWSMVFEMV